jgi:hypothetical protein
MEKCTLIDLECPDQNFRLVNRIDLSARDSATRQNHHSTQTKQCSVNIFLINEIVKRVSVGQTAGVVNRDSEVL